MAWFDTWLCRHYFEVPDVCFVSVDFFLRLPLSPHFEMSSRKRSRQSAVRVPYVIESRSAVSKEGQTKQSSWSIIVRAVSGRRLTRQGFIDSCSSPRRTRAVCKRCARHGFNGAETAL